MTDGSAWSGGAFGSRGRCFLAPNPGVMTLDGTNTWVLQEPGASASVVVDPGPIEDGHLERLTAELGDVGLVLLTHHHFDHAEVATELARRKGCPVRALEPRLCVDAPPLADGEDLDVDGLSLRVLTTPGHTADSISLVLAADDALLTGDMVLGRGTTVVAHPDGQLGPYFDSISRMRSLAASGEVRTLWPAHGPVLDDALGVLDHYLAHRRERLAQVERALAELAVPVSPELAEDPALPRRVVEVVYADVDESLWNAAELSVRAQLAYLAGR
jgi:glyoxylase-like metal-dependent hydrolase (beta-lactamase superfamily II)